MICQIGLIGFKLVVKVYSFIKCGSHVFYFSFVYY